MAGDDLELDVRVHPGGDLRILFDHGVISYPGVVVLLLFIVYHKSCVKMKSTENIT